MLLTGPCQLLMVGFQIIMLMNGPELLMSNKDQGLYQLKGESQWVLFTRVSNQVDSNFGGSKVKFILIWPLSLVQKGPPRYSEESVLQLERELVQARLKEAESQCALKEMQDKILDMEKVGD